MSPVGHVGMTAIDHVTTGDVVTTADGRKLLVIGCNASAGYIWLEDMERMSAAEFERLVKGDASGA